MLIRYCDTQRPSGKNAASTLARSNPAIGPASSPTVATELDLLVCGSGVAGLTAAVRAAAAGLRVGVVTKGELEQSATRWAQGGVAAVLGGEEDTVDSHLADTLALAEVLFDLRREEVVVVRAQLVPQRLVLLRQADVHAEPLDGE